MTSKPPAKPAIHPGTPEGVATPRYLDSVDVANQLIRQRVEMDIEGAAREAAGKKAAQAQARVRELGRFPKIEPDELTETSVLHRGRAINTSPDGRSWVVVAGISEDPMRRPFDAVTLVPFTDEYGNSYSEVIYWAELTKAELAENREQNEREAADHAEIEQADVELRRLIDKAITYQILPQGYMHIGSRTPTLDEAIALKEETGAEVEVRHRKGGSEVLVVRATTEAALLEAAAKLKSPPKFLAKRIRGFDAKVQLLVYLLEELKPLSIEWVQTGKRPMSETDIKQPANSLASDGAWLP